MKALPGRPDVVFTRHRLVVFVDGDFWHGRDLEKRLKKLSVGHNAPYWVQKIQGNVHRDRRHDETLRVLGWSVLRIWETEILRDPLTAAAQIAERLHAEAICTDRAASTFT